MRRTARLKAQGLGGRLLAAQTVVLLTGVLTAWIVTSVIGPPLFSQHLMQAGATPGPAEVRHAEEAFGSASLISMSVGLLTALATALAVSVFVTRRIGRSVGTVAEAASDIAGGRYDARVPGPNLGPEFDDLAAAFNAMADRLASIEGTRRRMLADLAHELRTPVATLDAYLEGLEDGVATADPETLAVLRGQTRRLARLAEDIGAVSRAEEHGLALHRVRTPVAALVDAAIAAAADRYAAHGVRLERDVAPGLTDLHVDAERIGQALGNLLDNALRHTPAGGAVTVTARSGPGEVVLAVTDTGAGIAAEHLPHVFERFYRVDLARDRQHGGSGIGLAITKALVEAHGGRVEGHSAGPGTGATFSLHLPA